MSQEERQMTPGEVLAEAGESLAGEGAVGNLPGPWDWQSVPYAPPFQTEGITYPQLVQVPMSYFPGIAQRPEPNVVSGDQVVSEDATRQYSWGNPYHHYPYHHYPYHHYPYHHYPYHHYPYHHYPYHHYPYHHYPYHHYPYHHYLYHHYLYHHYPSYYRTEEGGVTEGTDANAESNATAASLTAGEETRQLFPFIGISPFGPSFGFGFGGYGPFYPYYPPYYYRPPYYW